MCGLIALGMAFHFTPPTLFPGLVRRVAAWPAPLTGLLAGIIVLIIDALRFEGVAAFIYYQF